MTPLDYQSINIVCFLALKYSPFLPLFLGKNKMCFLPSKNSSPTSFFCQKTPQNSLMRFAHLFFLLMLQILLTSEVGQLVSIFSLM